MAYDLVYHLRSVLTYNSQTGVLKWNGRDRWHRKGQIAGTPGPKGYLYLSVGGVRYQAHRVAYMIYTGKLLKGEIDHLNGIRTDNRWANIKDGSHRDNMRNMAIHRKGKLPGATLIKASGKWRSSISCFGRKIHLGTYDTEAEAHIRYLEAVEIVQAVEKGLL